MSAPTTTPSQITPQEQAEQILMPQAAGYIGHKTVAIGLRQGLVEALADSADGMTADELAETRGFDPFYVAVWCRAALASGILELDGGRHRLAPHLDTLLLNEESPGYAGALFTLMEQPEMFDRFEASLTSGDRTWWDGASTDFIANVSATGRPFYTRLIPHGLDQVPGLGERLADECRIMDTACGAGIGVVRTARTYPHATIVGADGDAHSLELAAKRVKDAGVADRVSFIETPLEELEHDDEFALVINNISMHECRDLDAVTANVRDVLEPGGWFVISDLPFPEDIGRLRSVPGRIMTGIQYWEAQIDDQLLPRSYYDGLLARNGFTGIGSVEINPTHAITYGRAA